MYWHAWRLPPEPLPPGVPAAAQGWWALRFTPRVALLDEALLLEVQSTERLWGGRAALRALLRAQAPGSGPEAAQDWAEGPTALQALALLRQTRLGGPPPRRLPHDLPLATLTALRPHAQALQHLGCRTWGALRALPRAGVARRFGAACLAALDQAWGDAPEAAAWIELPAQFALEVELPALAESSTALLRPAERLLLALQGWLRARHQGVLALELAWRHDLRRHDGVELPPWQALVLRTAEPQQDMAHLRRLLAERLGRQRLAAPASHVALRSLQTGPMQGRACPGRSWSSASVPAWAPRPCRCPSCMPTTARSACSAGTRRCSRHPWLRRPPGGLMGGCCRRGCCARRGRWCCAAAARACMASRCVCWRARSA